MPRDAGTSAAGHACRRIGGSSILNRPLCVKHAGDFLFAIKVRMETKPKKRTITYLGGMRDWRPVEPLERLYQENMTRMELPPGLEPVAPRSRATGFWSSTMTKPSRGRSDANTFKE